MGCVPPDLLAATRCQQWGSLCSRESMSRCFYLEDLCPRGSLYRVGSQSRGVFIQRETPSPCGQNDWQKLLKTLPCPKLRLREVINFDKLSHDTSVMGWGGQPPPLRVLQPGNVLLRIRSTRLAELLICLFLDNTVPFWDTVGRNPSN